MVADGAGQARIPGPVVVGERFQHPHQGVRVDEVETEGAQAAWVEPAIG